MSWLPSSAIAFPSRSTRPTNESLDVVVCLGLLEHLPPDVCRKAVLEIGRITRVGGVAVLIMNNGRSAFLNQEQHYHRC